MRYVQLVELLTTGIFNCHVRGLTGSDAKAFEDILAAKAIPFKKPSKDKTSDLISSLINLDVHEIDTDGVAIINILWQNPMRLITQSMAIEVSQVGGRTIRTQKVIYTLGKE